MTACDDQTLLLSARRRGSAAGGAALLLAGGTLVCCALPILLVSIGLGTAVAALTSSVPWLVSLSQYKGWMFATAGFTLLATAALILRPGRACPGNPALARAYARADQWNRRVLWTGVSVWSIGFFMAYAWLPLQRWIGD